MTRLQKARAYASVPLEFSISGPVPSKEAIESRLAELLPSVKSMQKCGWLSTLLLVGASFAFMFFLVAEATLPVRLICLIPTLGAVVYGAVLTGIFDGLMRRLDKERIALLPVEPIYFQRLLELCHGSPEAMEYRAQVLEQGREFVRAEYKMLRKWAAAADERDVREALYGEAKKD